jgi:uncharacterized membrane protein YagU involved in acid resistance
MTVNRHFTGILVGGLIAAVLDIIYAIILTVRGGHSAINTLQAIASGLIGVEAFQGGIAAAALGIFLHCAILVVAAGVYYEASLRLPILRTRAVISGLLFGVLVYLFMNFIVIPLSAIPFTITYTPSKLAQGFISHAILVGLPISLTARHFSKQKD